MTNYTEAENHCRVDFFKESGKWYTTEAVWFHDAYYASNAVSAFEAALADHFANQQRLTGMRAVCLHPYCKNAYPVSVIV
jgi:hypothetical protein